MLSIVSIHICRRLPSYNWFGAAPAKAAQGTNTESVEKMQIDGHQDRASTPCIADKALTHLAWKGRVT
jgi:hypothetical protein